MPDCPHDWGVYHWYITGPGWTRFCRLCETFDPQEPGKYEKKLPLGGRVCQDCAPGLPCGLRDAFSGGGHAE